MVSWRHPPGWTRLRGRVDGHLEEGIRAVLDLAALGMIGTILVVTIDNVVVNRVDAVVFVVGLVGIVVTTPGLFLRWLLRK